MIERAGWCEQPTDSRTAELAFGHEPAHRSSVHPRLPGRCTAAGHEDYLWRTGQAGELLGHCEPVQVGQPDIEHDGAGAQLLNSGNSVGSGGGLADHLESVGFQQCACRDPELAMVVHDQHGWPHKPIVTCHPGTPHCGQPQPAEMAISSADPTGSRGTKFDLSYSCKHQW